MKRSNQKVLLPVNITADEAWDIIGAVSGVDQWFAGVITSCRVEGDKRICGTAQGEFAEDIVKVDHVNREFHYLIPQQHLLPISNIAGAMVVDTRNAEQAEIQWSWEFDVEEANEQEAKNQLQMMGEMGIKGIEDLVLNRRATAA